MFKIFFKKEHKVESLIFNYLENLMLSKDSFANALDSCFFNDDNCENFTFYIRQTHKYESKADDIREEINNMMYGKALIPDSRGDILGLLSELDAIPALFENILSLIQTQQLDIPKIIRPDLKELVRISLECCDLLNRQAVALLEKSENIRSLMNTIDKNESHCDHFERSMLTKMFESDIEPFLKLQLKELIQEVGKISDQADRVSKRINIISLKRRV